MSEPYRLKFAVSKTILHMLNGEFNTTGFLEKMNNS